MAAAVVDVQYLATYLSVPQQALSNIVDAPTAELVRSVLDAVLRKAREHDELAADKLQADIELENAIRSSETRVEGLKSSVEKAQKNVEEVRNKLKEEESLRFSLENELQTLKSSSTTSASEVEKLRTRIATLESVNRDTIAVLESKAAANDSLAQDLQKQHQKGLELSQQIAALQQSDQIASSTASSAKFREQSLRQELELAKRNTEWFENELKTKTAEALKYRKEKGARIAELQRLNEEVNANSDALKKTGQALRERLDEAQKTAEDSMHRAQQLQESAAKAEEGFKQELESAHRLAELQSQQTETHRNRLKEVEANLEKVKDDVAEEVARCMQTAEAEKQEREQAEYRISELEAEIDRLQAASQPFPGSGPATPRAGLNGSLMGRSGSPGGLYATPSSMRSRSSITATQAIDELYKVKGQLATEKRRGDRLATEMEEMMQALEAKQPEFDEMNTEHDRLQQEVVSMSKFVDQASKERERAKKDARKAESEASTSLAELNILQQQLRDLSAQIKMLLCDIDAKERGLNALTAVERSQLERIARGEVGEDSLEGMTDTDRFISQRLTVFRNISELQEKNQELLKITRQLGAQMESAEAISAKDQAAKDHEEVKVLQLKVENYKDEIQSMVTRSESYAKERDMFRRMLQHRGQLPPASDMSSMFGQSINGDQNGAMSTIEHKDAANYATLLRELQSHFDQYREEQTVDRRTLKEQAEKLSLEKGSLQAEVAKIGSQLSLATQRYDMLQSNFVMLQSENIELQKRSQILSESAAKQDVRTQQIAEDLIESKGLIESMRNESANLKAEKALWKNIQDRLSQENETLIAERAQLNVLVANQQRIQNERELSDSESRRRLQTQLESLEAELSSTKRKLNDETEDNKKAQLRKEYDSQQSQKRIDDLASSLGRVREELVGVKTTRDHLQSQVDDLNIKLKNAEERAQLLQPRPTPRPGVTFDEAGEAQDGAVSSEQELAVEISDLKRDLELARSELEAAKAQMEQYKLISQASEEELQSLNATQDEYREEMDRIIEERDSTIKSLQQRIEDISAELTTTNNDLTAVRNQHGEITRSFEEEKNNLAAEITRLKDEDERHATAAQFHQQDLRAQAEIATKAQQDYEYELLKHAEAAKALQSLRVEHNQLKSETSGIKAEAESARVTLSQSESSWEERQEQFQRELSELRTRRDDAIAQNKVLHQQLDNVTAQISALQQNRSSFPESSQTEQSLLDSVNDRSNEGLRELNTFLRREKEIVEVQYELKVQEAKRLQQQFEYTQSQLDEARLKLDQERRSNADGSRSNTAHKDLMDKLNELNLIRESSITLRNEARQAQAQLAEKTARVEELVQKIQPLETRILELEHSKEISEGEMRLLQEDRDRWQKRTQDIISKYDRIDPAEMEQLKETLETLKTENATLNEQQAPLNEKIQILENEKLAWQASRTKIVDQAKERSRIQTKNHQERVAERDAALAERDALQQQYNNLQEELATAVGEREAAIQQFTSIQEELASVNSERDQILAAGPQPTSTETPPAAVSSQGNEILDQQLVTLRSELSLVTQAKSSLEQELANLKEQLSQSNIERDTAISKAEELQINQAANAPNNTSEAAEAGEVTEASQSVINDDERKTLEERIAIAEQKAQDQEAKATAIEEQMETTIKRRSENMKAALNKKLAESRTAQTAELEAEYKLRFEQEKQIWLVENNSGTAPPPQSKPNGDVPPSPATPMKVSTPTSFDGSALSDGQVRELLSTNPTIKSILANNLKQKLLVETQKLKEESQKFKEESEKAFAEKLSEAQKKAENGQAQAVLLAEKKSSLKLNMLENRSRTAAAKLSVVETAAKETPTKAVLEVWEIAKTTVAPPPAPAAPAANSIQPIPQANSNGAVNPAVKPEVTTNGLPELPQAPPAFAAGQSSIPMIPNSSLPQIPQTGNNISRPTGIPRGGGAANTGNRGRGNGTYQAPRGGAQARGRGGALAPRGGMNPAAPNFNSGAAAPTPATGSGSGIKRPREDGNSGIAQPNNQGNKRPRGGGQQAN